MATPPPVEKHSSDVASTKTRFGDIYRWVATQQRATKFVSVVPCTDARRKRQQTVIKAVNYDGNGNCSAAIPDDDDGTSSWDDDSGTLLMSVAG